MVMLSAHAVPLKIVMLSTNAEASTSFFIIIRGTFGPCLTNCNTTLIPEPGGRRKSDSKQLKACNNPK